MKTNNKEGFHHYFLARTNKENSFSFIVLIVMLFTGQLFAQPLHGLCGGGLKIENLYNNKLEKLDIVDNNSVKIRNFVLEGKKILKEIIPATLALPPVRNYSYHRMYIVYKKQTMVIDFTGLIGENYDCVEDRIDSLVFQKGYFKYDFSKRKSNSYNYENSKRIENRLTLHNKKQLIKEGKLENNSTIDFSFLSNQDPPALSFFKKAVSYLEKNQTELALTELKKGVKKNKDPENCEISYLLCDIYTKTGQYGKAIENISKAINLNCRRDHNEYRYLENMSANYKTRIELFIKLKKYDKALQDYDTLYTTLNYDICIERANFKLKYLKDYAGTIDDLKKRIDEFKISEYPNKGTLLHGSFAYHNIYTTLAMAEYLNGNKKAAFRHWLKGEECGYWSTDYSPPGNYLDSIINQNPKISELFLARALIHYKNSEKEKTIEDTKKSFNNSLNDINKAEELGITDFRINMYRAIVLNQLEKYDEALQEIDLAILKDNQDPRCFWFRHIIRYNLGQIKEQFDYSEPDFKQYNILYKSWKWERY